jgi:hypothetical protein
MPINGHDPSSQTVFSPRQTSLTHPYPTSNGHVFSSRAPALRAASAGPSAVRPGGLGDVRESLSETTVDRPVSSVDGERSASRRWQDKVSLARDREALRQPASRQHRLRSAHRNGSSARVHRRHTAAYRTEPFTLHVSPLLKAEVKRLAEIDGVSASATGSALLEWAIRQKLHVQQAATLETALETILNRIIGKRDARLAHLLVRVAFACEQGRSLDSTILGRMPGITPAMLEEILDRSAKAAKAKITQSSPQLEEILKELQQMLAEKEEHEGTQPPKE